MKKCNKNQQLEKKVLRINEVCEDGTVERFAPDKDYTFDDLVTSSVKRTVLKYLFGDSISISKIEDKVLFWSDTRQYAAPFMYAVRTSELIPYDRNGELCSPLHMQPKVLRPLYQKLVVNYAETIYVGYGSFTMETGPFNNLFYISTDLSQNIEHMLLALKWGGSDSRTRGISAEEADDLGASYFIKCASNNGKEGIDYLILPVGSDSPLHRSFRSFDKILADERDRFRRKYRLYQTLLKEIDILEDESWNLLDAAIAQDEECRKQPVAGLDFVETPHGADISDLELTKISLEMSEDGMQQVVHETRVIISNVRRRIAEQEVINAAWKEFAPQFASLQPQIMTGLHGWLTIRGDHAELRLPSRQKNEKYDKTIYSFTERRLGNLMDDLEEYEQAEFGAHKKNAERLRACPTVEMLLNAQNAVGPTATKNKETAKTQQLSLT